MFDSSQQLDPAQPQCRIQQAVRHWSIQYPYSWSDFRVDNPDTSLSPSILIFQDSLQNSFISMFGFRGIQQTVAVCPWPLMDFGLVDIPRHSLVDPRPVWAKGIHSFHSTAPFYSPYLVNPKFPVKQGRKGCRMENVRFAPSQSCRLQHPTLVQNYYQRTPYKTTHTWAHTLKKFLLIFIVFFFLKNKPVSATVQYPLPIPHQ